MIVSGDMICKITAFSTEYDHFMPFGLTNAPSTFSKNNKLIVVTFYNFDRSSKLKKQKLIDSSRFTKRLNFQ